MARKKSLINMFAPKKSNVNFNEGHKSKGILDDFSVRKVLESLFGFFNYIGIGQREPEARIHITADGDAIKIDSNPIETENYAGIRIYPTSSMFAGQIYRGLVMNGRHLDAPTGTAAEVRILDMNLTGYESVDSDTVLTGIRFSPAKKEASTFYRYLRAEMDNDYVQDNFYDNSVSRVLSSTATYRSIYVDWSGFTVDAGSPELKAQMIELPADYTGFGECFGAKYEGDGRTVEIINDTSCIKVDSGGNDCAIDFSSMSVDEPTMKFVNDAITNPGTLSKQVAIDIEGTTYYFYAYTTGS